MISFHSLNLLWRILRAGPLFYPLFHPEINKLIKVECRLSIQNTVNFKNGAINMTINDFNNIKFI